jgi:hypothetical protein
MEAVVAVKDAEYKDVKNVVDPSQGYKVPEVIEFTKYESPGGQYWAEYTRQPSKDGKREDIVFHFYLTERKNLRPMQLEQLQRWWLHQFALALDVTAQEHFGCTAPRLQAKYTEEAASWWMKAQGFDHILDVDAFCSAFLRKLDAKLSQRS